MGERKTVLVSGASRGIGAAIAVDLAAAGYDIWLNYHSATAAAQAVAERVVAHGGRCTLLPFDVADAAAAEAALLPLLAETVPYALVHNAGITRDGVLALMPREDWDRVLAVHLDGFFILARMLTKLMLGRREGRIVAIGSIAAETGQAGQVNYAAAKAGLIGAVKALARELGRRNILVNVVSPGLIDTEMIAGLPLEKILPLIPLGRVGRVEEVSGVVRFLLSDAAGYLTGQVIGVNGGMHM